MDKHRIIEIMAISDGCRIECTEKDGECWTGYVDVFESDYDNQDDEKAGNSICVQRDDGQNVIVYDDEIEYIAILN